MNKIHSKERTFYGSTTIGEKGQVVIPAKARNYMKIAKGEKLLVFGMGENMLILAQFSQLQEIAKHLSEKLKGVQKIIKNNNK